MDESPRPPHRVRVCLASASPSRQAVLDAAGVRPVSVPAALDEGALIRAVQDERGALGLEDIVSLLARAKAETVADRVRREGIAGAEFRGLVLGCDSNFGLKGTSYGKPHTPERARERWREMSGRSGRLATGHWLIDMRAEDGPLPAVGEVEVSELQFATLDEAEIDAYVATGEPLEVAGGFTLEGRASAFIESIAGAPSNVMGVSVPGLRRLCRRLGVPWTSVTGG